MSTTYAIGLQKGLYSEDVSSPDRLPLAVRKAFGDAFTSTDPSKLEESEYRSYLTGLKSLAEQNGAKSEWGAWNRLPHKKGDRQVRKGHSSNTLMEVFKRIYDQEQQILNDVSISEQQQQESFTALVPSKEEEEEEEEEVEPAPEHSQKLSEEGEVPITTPDQELPVIPEIVVNSPKDNSKKAKNRKIDVVSAKRVEAILERVETNSLHHNHTPSFTPDQILAAFAQQIQRHRNMSN